MKIEREGVRECKKDVVGMLDFYGLAYSDHHRANFGYVRRNRQWIPVVIDVGIESFDGWDESIYGIYEDNDECDCSECCETRGYI